jgi:predicted transcriptional regulator
MNISAAESVVMETLWRKHPRSAEEIVAELRGEQPWQEATVKTLLNRLLTKRAIAAKKDGRRYLYWPRIERTKYLFAQSSGLIDRLFDGRLAPLVAHFSEHRKLSKKDIEELKRLIQDMEHGQ